MSPFDSGGMSGVGLLLRVIAKSDRPDRSLAALNALHKSFIANEGLGELGMKHPLWKLAVEEAARSNEPLLASAAQQVLHLYHLEAA